MDVAAQGHEVRKEICDFAHAVLGSVSKGALGLRLQPWVWPKRFWIGKWCLMKGDLITT